MQMKSYIIVSIVQQKNINNSLCNCSNTYSRASRCFQHLKLKAKGNIHKKSFYYQKNSICLETIIKESFIIKKKTGFDF